MIKKLEIRIVSEVFYSAIHSRDNVVVAAPAQPGPGCRCGW